jgi:hypothetical protein
MAGKDRNLGRLLAHHRLHNGDLGSGLDRSNVGGLDDIKQRPSGPPWRLSVLRG